MFDPSKNNIDLENNDINAPAQNKEANIEPLNNTESIKDDDIIDENIIVKNTKTNIDDDIIDENIIVKNTKTNIDNDKNILDQIIYDGNIEEKDIVKEKDVLEKNKTSDVDIISNKKEGKIIFDINITSIEELIKYNILKEYDYFILEPSEDKATISFSKKGVEVEKKYIKYPIYNSILLKAKSITKLKIDETEKEQEGSGEIKLNYIAYKIKSKIIPGNLGEKMYFKVQGTTKKVKKEVKKASINQILGFMAAGLFSILLISGVFLSFILFNSNSVEDLTFFKNIGVNVGSIREFTSKIVDIIFFSILFIETIILFIFSFKAILTKKEFKKQKIGKIIISVVVLIIVFLTATLWLTLSKKINDLNGLNYGKIEFYDNGRYLSEMFGEQGAKLNNNENIIGPISIRFNTEEFVKKLIDDGFNPKTITWIFQDEEIEKPISDYEIIKDFNKRGLHKISLLIKGTNIKNEKEVKEVEVASFNIEYLVQIEEKIEKSGGKRINIDASSLKNLGKVNWYYIEKGDEDQKLESIYTGYRYYHSQTIFNDALIGIRIGTEGDETGKLDQIFIINGIEENNIKGEIEYKGSIKDDLQYTFNIKDAETGIGAGYIEKYIWKIGNKIITKSIEDSGLNNGSEIEFKFNTYGEHYIEVELIDSAGNTRTLNTTIKIDKQLKFKKDNSLKIYNGDDLITNYKYQAASREYYIDNLGIPTKIRIDASGVRSEDYLYSLEKVEWDKDNDGNIDQISKILDFDIHTSGDYTILIKYTFKNKRKDERIVFNETIYISAEKKDAILDLRLIHNSDYTPVVVSFDASRSQIKGKDISKFLYDYGDGSPIDERDAQNPGHKYIKPGDYIITLTVITTDGSKYSISKKLVLKPEPQKAEITVSRKNVEVFDGIDFSSEKSVGQITNYVWNFGDKSTSIEANPTHFYKKPGIYTVKLTLDFKNRNTITDIIKITVTN